MKKIKFGYDEFMKTLKVLAIVILLLPHFRHLYNLVVITPLCHTVMPKKVIENIDMDSLYENIEKLDDIGAEKIGDNSWKVLLYDDEGEITAHLYITSKSYFLENLKKIKDSNVSYEYSFNGLFHKRKISEPFGFYMNNGKVEIEIEEYRIKPFKKRLNYDWDKELIKVLEQLDAYDS